MRVSGMIGVIEGGRLYTRRPASNDTTPHHKCAGDFRSPYLTVGNKVLVNSNVKTVGANSPLPADVFVVKMTPRVRCCCWNWIGSMYQSRNPPYST